MTLKELIADAQKLIADGVAPDTVVCVSDGRNGECDRAGSLIPADRDDYQAGSVLALPKKVKRIVIISHG